MDEDRTNGKVSLEIRNASRGGIADKRIVEINVRDHESGQLIVSIPMTADMLLGSLAGTHLGRLPAWIVPAELRSRIGLKSVHDSVKISRQDAITDEIEKIVKEKRANGDPYLSVLTKSDIETGSPLDAWILEAMQHDGWQEWNLRNHNYGWALHLTKYVDSSEIEKADWEREV